MPLKVYDVYRTLKVVEKVRIDAVSAKKAEAIAKKCRDWYDVKTEVLECNVELMN